MAKIYSTPGVYIEEKNAFSNSVVPVASAVPCFIGFTEKATRDNKPIFKQLFKIASLDEYNRYFGGAPLITYAVTINNPLPAPTDENPNPDPVEIDPVAESQFYLYNSLKLYFNNGGGDCYIYSTGPYKKEDNTYNELTTEMIDEALKQLAREPEPTIIVIPDGHKMNRKDYYGVWQKVLPHCRSMINRFAILDIHGGGDKKNLNDNATIESLYKTFREHIGSRDLDFGAVYWPWVQTSIVQPNDLSFRNISNLEEVKAAINKETNERHPNTGESSNPLKEALDEIVENLGKQNVAENGEPLKFEEITTFNEAALNFINQQHNALLQSSPLYKAIMTNLRETANILPPSGAMAGVYKAVDSSIGTHQAPANISLISVSKPLVNLKDEDQEALNIPIDGKAINAIRTFPGKGILVWGARTMDGNSQDWRYISVRRTVSMIELSIKYAAEAFVFEPNVASTWSNLKAMASNFLTNMWYAGALAGATPESSFSVDVGLGTTMTPVDILDGYMRISVKIAVTRPAEFIVITFEQQMQTS